MSDINENVQDNRKVDGKIKPKLKKLAKAESQDHFNYGIIVNFGILLSIILFISSCFLLGNLLVNPLVVIGIITLFGLISLYNVFSVVEKNKTIEPIENTIYNSDEQQGSVRTEL